MRRPPIRLLPPSRCRPRLARSARVLLALIAIAVLPGQLPGGEAPIDFNREVRPILSENCFTCHGPDEAQRKRVKTSLRLDLKEGLFAKLDDIIPVVPGDPAHSEVVKRITATDPDDHMPPEKSGKTLSAHQQEVIAAWVRQGAPWTQHWAFVAPRRPAIPPISHQAAARSDIDRLVIARLERDGLSPSPEAGRATLIRRVSLDLTGLPPTPGELAAFLADQAPDAYEQAVDRLLASPHYGERMAMSWLDGARYADSNGYQADYERFMSPWRDWVIDAFNRNLPFDRFTVEQLAGDLLPDATPATRIATGFNRNHRINTEGGVIPEEWRVETVIDRVETTGQVWLGLTIGCARCHDHKYDPISQKDFYRFFAFFNNVPEKGNGEERPVNHPPLQQVIGATEEHRLAELQHEVAQAKEQLAALEPRFQADLPGLEERLLASAAGGSAAQGLIGDFPLHDDVREQSGSWSAGAWKLGPPSFGAGIDGGAALFDGSAFVEVGSGEDGPPLDRGDAFSYGAWIKRSGGGAMTVLSRMDDAKANRGYDLFVSDGRIAAHLISSWPDDALKVIAKPLLKEGEWTHVFITYDGSSKAAGVKIFINGAAAGVDVEADKLKGSIAVKQPLRIGSRQSGNRWKGQIEDLRIFRRALAPDEIALLGDAPQRAIAAIPAAKRSAHQEGELTAYLRGHGGHEIAKADRALEEAERKEREYRDALPTVMVMAELPKPRETHVLIRGQYDHPGEMVSAGVPALFPPLPKDAPANRLGLALWITDPANPLTARVAVNRMWERLFGVGLVKTSENLGSQAEQPSHPELLDWLACELVDLHWDQKAMLKELVMSATYRQSSRIDPQQAKSDPENRLLAHGPRFRLQAEMIRDQALCIAGLLSERIGGPSVRPYQPDGIWDELSNYGNLHNYKHDQGENLYRRSLYTIWKRTTPPPDVSLFDMPSREYCVVRRSRTNTPLQALTLLNDLTFVEAARVLAERMMRDGGTTVDERIAYGFRRATARPPNTVEAKVLHDGFDRRLAHFRSAADEARKLIAVGDGKSDAALDPSELAAYATTASIILNLDETITKE
jgi:hypothetical protein